MLVLLAKSIYSVPPWNGSYYISKPSSGPRLLPYERGFNKVHYYVTLRERSSATDTVPALGAGESLVPWVEMLRFAQHDMSRTVM